MTRWKLAAPVAALLLAALPLACGASPPETAGEGGAAPAPSAPAADGEPATDAWDRVLRAHAAEGALDYGALQQDRADLDTFLASLAAADPGSWSEARRLAFWINAYNAVVVHHVLERYPGIESVKSVDGFFKQLTYPVAGAELTLDAIEERARELDPRVHFAVVCASTSCPDLRPEAYRADRIDAQLEDQTRIFLSQPDKGLRYDREANHLWLSSIFKWYAGDFTGGSRVVAFFARGGLVKWVLPHLPEELAREIERREPGVKYMDYDWSLNDRAWAGS